MDGIIIDNRIKRIQLVTECPDEPYAETHTSSMICAVCQMDHGAKRCNPIKRDLFADLDKAWCSFECDCKLQRIFRVTNVKLVSNYSTRLHQIHDDDESFHCVAILIQELYKTKKMLYDTTKFVLKDSATYTSKIPADILHMILDYVLH